MVEWTRAEKLAALGVERDAEADAYAAVADPRVKAVLEVLAPNRIPLFEWGHETTPTASEMIDLARSIVEAIDRAS